MCYLERTLNQLALSCEPFIDRDLIEYIGIYRKPRVKIT